MQEKGVPAMGTPWGKQGSASPNPANDTIRLKDLPITAFPDGDESHGPYAD
jgi:hypothetical protein